MSKKKERPTNYPILNKMFSIFVLEKKLTPLERLGNRLGYMDSKTMELSDDKFKLIIGLRTLYL